MRQVILVLNFLVLETGYSQLKEINSFGVVQEFTLPVSVQCSSLLQYSSIKYPDIVFFSSDSSQIGIVKNNGSGIFNTVKMVSRTTAVTSISSGNINNDEIDDIVIVHRDQNQIELLLSNKADSSYASTIFPVNFYPEKVIIDDINNDKIPDIVSYGKLSTGICVLLGKGGGKFQPKKTLFENIPVGDFAIVSLNADDIADAAVYNWLTNETILFLGFGKLKFSEQTVLSFAQDSVKTIFGDFNDDDLADVAVSSTQNKTIQILSGDGLGSFSVTQTISTAIVPDIIFMKSINRINSQDIILANTVTNQFSVLINGTNGMFYDEIIFGNDQNPSEIIVGDMNADGFTDLISIHHDRMSYSIFWNSQTQFQPFQDHISLAVGASPNNLSVGDLNDDGIDDIVVSNFESSTISFLLSREQSFSGQISIDVPEKPYSVSFYSKTDSTMTFYTTHQENPQISIFTLRKSGDSLHSFVGDIEQFTIPLPDKPTTVLPDISYMQKGISFYAFMATSTNAIVFYQQIKGTRFLAKNLVPNIQSKILYATISDLDNDGKTDLSYIYNQEKIKNGILGVSMNDSAGEFKGKIVPYTISDSTIKKAYLYFDDVNGDQVKDCLVFSSPNNTIQLALGSKEKILERFDQIIDNVNIRIPEQLQFADVDNDGINDILYLNKESSNLLVFRGKNNGKFFSPMKYKTLPKESQFRSGDFNGDSITDIVYTNPAGHTITIEYGKKN